MGRSARWKVTHIIIVTIITEGGAAAPPNEVRRAKPRKGFAKIALRFCAAASHLYIKLKRHSEETLFLLCLKFSEETHRLLCDF